MQTLLATLVAAKPDGRIAELGTAFGEGTKAMLAALAPSATLVTVEADPERHKIACEELDGTRAEVILGDWREALRVIAAEIQITPETAAIIAVRCSD